MSSRPSQSVTRPTRERIELMFQVAMRTPPRYRAHPTPKGPRSR